LWERVRARPGRIVLYSVYEPKPEPDPAPAARGGVRVRRAGHPRRLVGIYLRPDRGRHFLKAARYRWRAPSWMARLVLHLGAEGAPPSATAAPQRRLARARTGSWPGPPSTQTSPRWRPGRPASEPPGRPRPCAAPSAAGRRPAADSRRGIPGRRGCGPATPGARRRPRPHGSSSSNWAAP
jgi:hypothetical protein